MAPRVHRGLEMTTSRGYRQIKRIAYKLLHFRFMEPKKSQTPLKLFSTMERGGGNKFSLPLFKYG